MFSILAGIVLHMVVQVASPIEEFDCTEIWNNRCDTTITWEKSIHPTTRRSDLDLRTTISTASFFWKLSQTETSPTHGERRLSQVHHSKVTGWRSTRKAFETSEAIHTHIEFNTIARCNQEIGPPERGLAVVKARV